MSTLNRCKGRYKKNILKKPLIFLFWAKDKKLCLFKLPPYLVCCASLHKISYVPQSKIVYRDVPVDARLFTNFQVENNQ